MQYSSYIFAALRLKENLFAKYKQNLIMQAGGRDTFFLAASLSRIDFFFHIHTVAFKKLYDGKKTTSPLGTIHVRFKIVCPSSSTCITNERRFDKVYSYFTYQSMIATILVSEFKLSTLRSLKKDNGLQIWCWDDMTTWKTCYLLCGFAWKKLRNDIWNLKNN